MEITGCAEMAVRNWQNHLRTGPARRSLTALCPENDAKIWPPCSAPRISALLGLAAVTSRKSSLNPCPPLPFPGQQEVGAFSRCTFLYVTPSFPCRVGGTETATAGGDFFAVASAMQGVGSCACADLEVATTMPLNQPPKPDYPCCDPELFGSNSPKMMCTAFGTDAEGFKYCANATLLNHNTDCMIESCCLVEDDNPAGPTNPGAGPGPGGGGPGGGSGEGPGPGPGGGDPSNTCSIFIDGSGTFTGVFVSSGGGGGGGSDCYTDSYGHECCIDEYGSEVCCWYNEWGEQECDNGYYRRAVQGIDSGRRVGKSSGAQARTGRSNHDSESSVVRRPQVSNSARLAKRRNKGAKGVEKCSIQRHVCAR